MVAGDVPLYGGIDTVKLARGLVAEAERRSASWYDADWCRYSTGGSTHCNQALCLAIGQPGDKVVVTRSLHRSLLLGMVLADLEPCWLPTTIDTATGMPLGVAVEDVESTLAANPDARAVLITEPDYLGTLSDVAGIIEVAHGRDVPVIVDQAWGAHFGHHPELPPDAMALGADAMVTSIHKLLLGYTQASLVCARTQRLDRDRLQRGFDASQTTSSAGSVLASIDACRALMEARGPELVEPVLRALKAARQRLRDEIPGLEVPDEQSFPPGRFDPMSLVLLLSRVGANGIEVEHMLIDQGIPLELVDRDTIVALVTIADDESTLDKLVEALVAAIPATSRPTTLAHGRGELARPAGEGDEPSGGFLRVPRAGRSRPCHRAHLRRADRSLPAGHPCAGPRRARHRKAPRRPTRESRHTASASHTQPTPLCQRSRSCGPKSGPVSGGLRSFSRLE